ncbi:hypothetical protein D3C77_501710 [compost metagenome]
MKAEIHRLILPFFRHCKRPDVRADRVVNGWRKGGLKLRLRFRPRITDIRVLRIIIAMKLPVRGYGKLRPIAIVIV